MCIRDRSQREEGGFYREETIPAQAVVLAIGHSARDTFRMLSEKSLDLQAKAFAVGLRIQHPQKQINFSQYGVEEPGSLGAASYKLTKQTSSGRGIYSFCMCPGGFVAVSYTHLDVYKRQVIWQPSQTERSRP